MELYEVGGCVRDEILGVPSRDIDFTVVLDDGDFTTSGSKDPYNVMEQILRHRGFTIYPVKGAKENFTIRGRFPDYRRAGAAVIGNRAYSRRDADFVLARVEGPYSDGRRPDWVKPGTLEDDLARRDFTMNAIAKGQCPECGGSGVMYEIRDCLNCDSTGIAYIDPFNGRQDIEDRIIRAVGDPYKRLNEDALRAVRAIRFAVTKGFNIDPELEAALDDREICEKVKWKISDERIAEEVSKMMRYDTIGSLYEFSLRNRLTTAIFSGRVSLDSTLKTKGRGK